MGLVRQVHQAPRLERKNNARHPKGTVDEPPKRKNPYRAVPMTRGEFHHLFMDRFPLPGFLPPFLHVLHHLNLFDNPLLDLVVALSPSTPWFYASPTLGSRPPPKRGWDGGYHPDPSPGSRPRARACAPSASQLYKRPHRTPSPFSRPRR